MKRYLLCLSAFLVTVAVQAQPGKTSRPNVIFIYTDDMGRGMLSSYGQQIVPTPNIDFLARGGMRFENIYGSMYCAPARASMLTGYSDVRKGKFALNRAGIYINYLKGQLTLPEVDARLEHFEQSEQPGMVLPQVFKKAGYVTGEVGKLEWGFATSRKQMAAHGWDYYYGYLDHRMCHGFYPMVMFENGEPVRIAGNTRPDSYLDSAALQGKDKPQYAENLFMEKAQQFIVSNKDKPFFLYYPTNLPHGPVSVPAIDPLFANNPRLTTHQKMYASMIKMVDDNVGRFTHLIDSLGLSKNTLIIFGSDNGHWLYYEGKQPKYDNITTPFYSDGGADVFNGNSGLAGLKETNWEGGVRVPFICYWPGKVPAGTVNRQLVANYDLLSTMADLLKVKVPDQKDGRSYLPSLLGKPFKPRDQVVFSSFMGPALVTHDGWKLRTYLLNNKQVFQLYHLPTDKQEKKDLAAQYPQKVDSLKQALTKACDGRLNNGIFYFTRLPATALGE
ncbi:sulfatase-like hydrolase/transferase [Chitinophaga qingshengii]|uniref:Sulfatase-like hydrolase/transferase n=1 Tax=Chitinophaga qingshengii TaxID=1569794 RepID=A0ABR7TH19_9BACT|nr:sulfatase-like hydrolase/transferase [Chitinophaga qingshengii]MBC9929734.1 sulfatase-like hydrolase/transferase [Chitinophaga qingshengii]